MTADDMKAIREFGGPALAYAVQHGKLSIKEAAACARASQPVAAAPVAQAVTERQLFNQFNNDIDCPLAGLEPKNAAWRAWLARAALQQRQAPANMDYRTCCDHPDCTTCAGHGGYYRLKAEAAPAPIAEPCDYFMPKGRLCPKCGQVHGGQSGALPEDLPTDVLRYAMECSGNNTPAGARLVKSIYRFVREALASSMHTPARCCTRASSISTRKALASPS
jgi:hypothetical protein